LSISGQAPWLLALIGAFCAPLDSGPPYTPGVYDVAAVQRGIAAAY
jgi:hypothetical protein